MKKDVWWKSFAGVRYGYDWGSCRLLRVTYSQQNENISSTIVFGLFSWQQNMIGLPEKSTAILTSFLQEEQHCKG
jgi:hypothetical protein